MKDPRIKLYSCQRSSGEAVFIPKIIGCSCIHPKDPRMKLNSPQRSSDEAVFIPKILGWSCIHLKDHRMKLHLAIHYQIHHDMRSCIHQKIFWWNCIHAKDHQLSEFDVLSGSTTSDRLRSRDQSARLNMINESRCHGSRSGWRFSGKGGAAIVRTEDRGK